MTVLIWCSPLLRGLVRSRSWRRPALPPGGR
jgi:hypothetical protein